MICPHCKQQIETLLEHIRDCPEVKIGIIPFREQVFRPKRKNIADSIRFRIIRELKEVYGEACLRCGEIPKRLTLDHIIPRSKGGENKFDNYQLLCSSCNNWKGDQTIDYRRTQTSS